MEKLNIIMNLRLTKEDKELITKYCNDHNYIISRFVRSAILDTIKNNMKNEENKRSEK